jgi:hypothetical protein
VVDLNGDGLFQSSIDWIQNQRGDKRFLSTSNPQGSGDGVLAYKDPTTGELHLFRDAIDANGQSYPNAIEHLRALKDQQKDGVVEGKELEGIYLLRADGSAVPAEQVIKSIRLGYETVNEQGGLVQQRATLAVELTGGGRVDMANLWPEANTLESVNTGIPPEALGNPELQARLANIPNIHSTGNTVLDLRHAAAKDPVLLERIEALQRKIAHREEVTQAEWESVVFRWTGVEAVTGSSFGMDNRRVQALRRLLSHEEGLAFGADGHGVQSQTAASSLNGQFDRYLERYKLLFAGRVRSKTESALYNIAFDPNTLSFQSLRTGDTITTTNQTKMESVVTGGRQGQMATTGSGNEFFVINWYEGKINGISDHEGNLIYGNGVNVDRDGAIDMNRTLRERVGAEYSITDRWGRQLIYSDGPGGLPAEPGNTEPGNNPGGSSTSSWNPLLFVNTWPRDEEEEVQDPRNNQNPGSVRAPTRTQPTTT